MTRTDLDTLRIRAGDAIDLATGKPSLYTVTGLSAHLEADISYGQQWKYTYDLRQHGRVITPQPRRYFPTLNDALEAIKRQLTGE
jgi:hypothetical protein